MSQASTSTVINAINSSNNSNNSTWNRTPGKPGVGGGTGYSTTTSGSSAIAVTTSTTAVSTSASVPKTNNCPSADLVYSVDAFVSRDHRRTGAFSAVDGNSSSLAFPLADSLDQPEFVGALSSIPPLGPGQMWPPPFFETPEGITNDGNNNNNKINSDINTSTSNFTSHTDISTNVSGAQWSIASRTASVNAALFAEPSQAIVPAGGDVWSLDAGNNPAAAAASAANSSTGPTSVTGMPRAITGQLHQSSSAGGDSTGDVYPQLPHAKASASAAAATTAGAAPGTVWSTGRSLNDPAQLLTGDQSTLSSAFSKLHMTGATGHSDCFHDFSDGQLQIPPGILTISQPSSEPELHAAVAGGCSTSKGCDKKSSVDTSEVDVMYTPDPEDAIQAIVNSTEPWGTIPVDQSSPWDLTELSTAVVGATGSGLDPVDCAALLPSADGRSLFDTSQQGPTGPCSGGQQRRLAASSSASRGDFESNVWPREPPNGTGIWEAHYEILGERTARWQQQPSVNLTQQQPSGSGPGPNQPSSSGQQFGQLPPPSAIPGNRSHFSGAAVASPVEAPALFCAGSGGGYPIRSSAGPSHPGSSGLSGPLGSGNRSVGAGGGGPMSQLQLVDSLHPNGSSRNFPMAGSSTAWMHGCASGGLGAGLTGGGPTALDQKASRWPGNSNLGRIPGKHQHQQSFQSMLSAATGGGGAPSHANLQMPSGWPPTDPRRSASNALSLRWSSTTGGGGADSIPTAGGSAGASGSAGYYGVPSPMHPLISPSMPPPGPRGFRPSLPVPPPQHQQHHGMFFQPPGQSSSSLSSSHRAGLLSTQQQLQQQSVLRANAMRQMISMGFSEDDVHAVFSDINANIPRALLELRERTCHSGLDDIIRMFTNNNSNNNNNNSSGGGTTNTGQFAMSTADDLGVGEFTGPIARMLARYGLSMPDQQHQQLACKVNSQMGGASSPENVDAALAIMRQKEAQLVQTIVQLNNKRVELMTANMRQPNLQYPSGFMPVLNELRQQEILINHQMNAQEAQLRHIRRQAEMLKQLTVASPSPPHQQSMGGSLGTSGGQPWPGNVCLSGGGAAASPSLSSLSSGFVSGSGGVDMTVGGGPPGVSDMHQLLLQQMGIEAGGYPEQCQPPAGACGVGGNAGLKMGSGSFLWESGPWSGQTSSSAQAGSQDGYSQFNTVVGGGGQNTTAGGGGDNRRTSWSTNRQLQPGFPPSTTGLGADPRWIPGLESSSLGADDEYFDGVGSGSSTAAGGGSRHWLLVHNIPPHMSVSVIKAAVASALAKSTAGGGAGDQQLLDFELHPNMSARWVLLGVNTAASANLVLDYLDGGNAGGGHYGCVKSIGAVEAFQRLQDIQSLACRLKGLAADSSSVPSGASGHGFIRSVSAYQHHHPTSQLPFSIGNDLGMHDGTAAAAALFATSSACEGAALGGI